MPDPRFDAGAPEYEALFARSDLRTLGYDRKLLPTHPAIEEAMVAAIRDGRDRHYGPAYGLARLRELFLKDLELPGVEAIITSGWTCGSSAARS